MSPDIPTFSEVNLKVYKLGRKTNSRCNIHLMAIEKNERLWLKCLLKVVELTLVSLRNRCYSGVLGFFNGTAYHGFWNTLHLLPDIFFQNSDCVRLIGVDFALQITPEHKSSGVRSGECEAQGMAVLLLMCFPGKWCCTQACESLEVWGVACAQFSSNAFSSKAFSSNPFRPILLG